MIPKNESERAMGINSSIGWCEHTANFWFGCLEVSPACRDCYAREEDKRRSGKKREKHWGSQAPRRAIFGIYKELRKWNRIAKAAGDMHRVFSMSMGDLLEEYDGPVETIQGERLFTGDERLFVNSAKHRPLVIEDLRQLAWQAMRENDWLLFLILTKRPENIHKIIPADLLGRHNVALGATVEHRDYYGRFDFLLEAPAAFHFVSIEPQIDCLNVNPWLPTGSPTRPTLDWVITGGESRQPGIDREPRPYDTTYATNIVNDCHAAGVAAYVKQMGSVMQDDWYHCKSCNLRLTFDDLGMDPEDDYCPVCYEPTEKYRYVNRTWNDKGDDIEQWPHAIRVREIPAYTLPTGERVAAKMANTKDWPAIMQL